MKNYSGMPAVPLFTHDPFFSYWDCGVLPTADVVRHWSGAEKNLKGMIEIDGRMLRFIGRGGKRPMALVSETVTPLSSLYRYEELGVSLTVKYTSPLLPDDLDILSTPVSFVEFAVDFTDRRAHQVKLSLTFDAGFCAAGEIRPAMRSGAFSRGELRFVYMGQNRQNILSGAGDHLTQDWGYLMLASSEGIVDDSPNNNAVELRYRAAFTEPGQALLLVGYDDIASINYFGRLLPAYYARKGKTLTRAMEEFHARREELLARCAAFDGQLLQEAEALGGKAYAKILTAAYRQSVAAHKLAEDPEGQLLFISKENDSNGCAATADVSYPSVPLFLKYCPELVRGMLRPVLKFARSEVWHYDFAPHDAGRYPWLTGQFYGSRARVKGQETGSALPPLYLYTDSEDLYKPERQMPVEESANMILMLAAAARADGDLTLCRENLDLTERWCGYLLTFGEDPGEQLCTDDFAGHLAHNINLSAKALMGVAAYAWILEQLGRKAEAGAYMAKAKAMADSWLKRAQAPEGYTYLTFDGQGWSQKYNLVWDKLFGFGLLPDSFYEQELDSYLPRMNAYGLPLDSRADYTKSDWSLWCAAMSGRRSVLDAFTAPMARFLEETLNRVPFSDWYDTVTGTYEQFMARSVQGGLFMPLLMQAWHPERKQK